MADTLRPRCELGECNYFRLSEMSDETKNYIFSECRRNLELRLQHDSSFDETQCPQAALTAAVITKLAVQEGEIETMEE